MDGHPHHDYQEGGSEDGGLVSTRLLAESSYRSYLRCERGKQWKASSWKINLRAS